MQFPGFVPLAKTRDLLDLADGVGDSLQRRDTTLFVRDGCGWCKRQLATLGPNAAKVDIVRCEADGGEAARRRCADAGVGAVPAWQIGGNSTLLLGYQPLPALKQLVELDSAALKQYIDRRA